MLGTQLKLVQDDHWSFEEKTLVKQSLISEWEKCAQKVRYALTMLRCGGRGVGVWGAG